MTSRIVLSGEFALKTEIILEPAALFPPSTIIVPPLGLMTKVESPRPTSRNMTFRLFVPTTATWEKFKAALEALDCVVFGTTTFLSRSSGGMIREVFSGKSIVNEAFFASGLSVSGKFTSRPGVSSARPETFDRLTSVPPMTNSSFLQLLRLTANSRNRMNAIETCFIGANDRLIFERSFCDREVLAAIQLPAAEEVFLTRCFIAPARSLLTKTSEIL